MSPWGPRPADPRPVLAQLACRIEECDRVRVLPKETDSVTAIIECQRTLSALPYTLLLPPQPSPAGAEEDSILTCAATRATSIAVNASPESSPSPEVPSADVQSAPPPPVAAAREDAVRPKRGEFDPAALCTSAAMPARRRGDAGPAGALLALGEKESRPPPAPEE
jgi:hypothetical protein